jgi:excinuclease ABC subunit C
MSNKNITGSGYIKSIINDIPTTFGVYQMFNNINKIIYIGKAKNLQNRIYSYAQGNLNTKTSLMVQNIASIKWLTTKSEQDALILESDLIKSFKPKFNILLKDDKSLPFIKLTLDHPYPQILKLRSKNKTSSKDLFGPFASTNDLKEFIKLLQQLFLLRSCSDSFFNNRKSPCILYQIKRCSAPCVNKIEQLHYKNLVEQSIAFLKGKNTEIKQDFITKMNIARDSKDFEQAIVYRDRLKAFNNLLAKQSVLLSESETADFIAIIPANSNFNNNLFYIKIYIFQNGHNYGSIDRVVQTQLDESIEEVLESFIMQFYGQSKPTNNLYVNIIPHNVHNIENLLSEKNNNKIKIKTPNTPQHKSLMQSVVSNALEYSVVQQKQTTKWQNNLELLANFLNLKEPINCIEIYDNSHFFATLALGVCVYADAAGFNKNNYKIFNLKNENIKQNDDYGILNEVLTRRFAKEKLTKYTTPNLIFIDGGIGQLNTAIKSLNVLSEKTPELKNIFLVAIAKGENRNMGQETLFLSNGLVIENKDIDINILHFIQTLRNETHRFAVSSVRKRKEKNLTTSVLDNISGIGKARKKLLFDHFISLEKIKTASIEELKKVKGMNQSLAEKIYNYFK